MGIKQLYNDKLRKLPNEYGDVSVMNCPVTKSNVDSRALYEIQLQVSVDFLRTVQYHSL